MKDFAPLRGEFPQRPSVRGYLLDVCMLIQQETLEARGISLLFDFNSGSLSAWRCNAVGRILRALIDDVCNDPRSTDSGGTIRVTLHRTGQIWVLAVTDQGVRTIGSEHLYGRTSPVEELAQALKGTCRSWLRADGAINAVLFTSKPWWANAADLVTLIVPSLHISTSVVHRPRLSPVMKPAGSERR